MYYLCAVGRTFHGTISIFENVPPCSIPTDINDNRRHVHVFKKGSRHMTSVAKIWIESNGNKCIEIAYSGLTTKDNEMLLSAIDKHWEFINDQISRTFRGEKTKVKDLGK